MQHHPQIVLGDVERSTNLLALDAIDFAHREDSGNVFGHLIRAVVKSLPERLAVEARAGVSGPFKWSEFVDPAAGERPFGDEALAFLVLVEIQIGERSLATGLAIVVENLVFEDADEPALLRAASSEGLPALERRQEGFLHHVLRLRRIAQTHEGKLE